jgi:hypothetical protein
MADLLNVGGNLVLRSNKRRPNPQMRGSFGVPDVRGLNCERRQNDCHRGISELCWRRQLICDSTSAKQAFNMPARIKEKMRSSFHGETERSAIAVVTEELVAPFVRDVS